MYITILLLSLSIGMRNGISSAHEFLICHSSSSSTEQLFKSKEILLNTKDLQKNNEQHENRLGNTIMKTN